ncbi:dipeptide epimerase [Pacificimonas flava]|uniref:Dipeptide epimerase n=2 Tax=Pacificimonas TaxID=1960290 RepID=A0A219B914_9SPHN|nr:MULTISPECIES: N-acetyl-D-Glu racemase DgcA [Pacificimonas]MBZ6378398.1 dipeptide epimerase [Pacificimonas aurantium]OWV34299.1 dipeptide epimerase [Pacificimonas flava]
MSRQSLFVEIERFPTRGAFTISRGAKTHVDVVTVRVRRGAHEGRGEGTAIYYRGESAETAAQDILALHGAVADGLGQEELQTLLPAGAARSALDSALWDLEAKETGMRVWQRIGLPRPQPLLTAFTISSGEPEVMEAAARAASGRELLKVKLAGAGDEERIRAVRAGAPHARLICDANEAWEGRDIEAEAAALLPYRVELIEQPLPAGRDADLDHVDSPIPLCADESVHDLASLDACLGRYHYINVKLDKAGGLTEALRLIEAARAAGIGVMTGCMLSTSLGVAPAFFAAMQGQYADLDGPILLAKDREGGMRFDGSDVFPPTADLWG